MSHDRNTLPTPDTFDNLDYLNYNANTDPFDDPDLASLGFSSWSESLPLPDFFSLDDSFWNSSNDHPSDGANDLHYLDVSQDGPSDSLNFDQLVTKSSPPNLIPNLHCEFAEFGIPHGDSKHQSPDFTYGSRQENLRHQARPRTVFDDAHSECSSFEPEDQTEAISQVWKDISALRQDHSRITAVTKPLAGKARRKIRDIVQTTGLAYESFGCGQNKRVVISKCQFFNSSLTDGFRLESGLPNLDIGGGIDPCILIIRVPQKHSTTSWYLSYLQRMYHAQDGDQASDDASWHMWTTCAEKHPSSLSASKCTRRDWFPPLLLGNEGVEMLPKDDSSAGGKGEAVLGCSQAQMRLEQRLSTHTSDFRHAFESAIADAIRDKRLAIIAVVNEIYKWSLSDPQLRTLLWAVHSGNATEGQTSQFQRCFRAATSHVQEVVQRKIDRDRHEMILMALEPSDLDRAFSLAGLPHPARIIRSQRSPGELHVVFQSADDAASTLYELRNGGVSFADTTFHCDYLHVSDSATWETFRAEIFSCKSAEEGNESSNTLLESSETQGCTPVASAATPTIPGERIIPPDEKPSTGAGQASASTSSGPQNKRKQTEEIVQEWTCSFPRCSKAFRTAGECRKHGKIHQERPHVCVFCKKGFLYAKDVRRHKSSVHKDLLS